MGDEVVGQAQRTREKGVQFDLGHQDLVLKLFDRLLLVKLALPLHVKLQILQELNLLSNILREPLPHEPQDHPLTDFGLNYDPQHSLGDFAVDVTVLDCFVV